MRHLIAVLCGLTIAAASACNSSDTTSSTTTTEAPRTSSTEVVPGSVPAVTRPENVEKVDPAKLPARTQAIKWGTSVSQDEQDCVNYVVYRTAEENPAVAADNNQLAGVTGAAMVTCVPQEKVAALLTEDLKGKATETQIDCVKQQVVMAEPQALAVFLGGLAIEEPTIIASVSQALDAACGTSLAATK